MYRMTMRDARREGRREEWKGWREGGRKSQNGRSQKKKPKKGRETTRLNIMSAGEYWITSA